MEQPYVVHNFMHIIIIRLHDIRVLCIKSGNIFMWCFTCHMYLFYGLDISVRLPYQLCQAKIGFNIFFVGRPQKA